MTGQRTNERILERIKKCFALTQSGNEHEAAAALKRAQSLMKKYGIGQHDVTFAGMGSKKSSSKVQAKPAAHYAMLANVISRAFGVKPLLSWNGKYHCIEFIGSSDAIEIARYSFDVCVRELNIARKIYIASIHKNCKKQTKTKRADSYCQGWVEGITLPPLEVEDDHYAMVESYCSHINGGVDKARVTNRVTGSEWKSYFDGRKAGEQFSVLTPVKGERRQKLLR